MCFCFTSNENCHFSSEKNGETAKRVVDFPLERDTFRNKIMEFVEDFDEKSYNNNGKAWKSSRIFVCESKFLDFSFFFHHFSSFFHFSFFFFQFFPFFHFLIFSHFLIFFFVFFIFSFFSFFSFFHFSFFHFSFFQLFSFFEFFNFFIF